MEDFYRDNRRRIGLLMDGAEPVRGRWNFDAENRTPAKPDLFLPQAPDATPDAVTEEVSGVPGVTAVRVDLERGELAVTRSTDVERSALAAAVDEAGYTLV